MKSILFTFALCCLVLQTSFAATLDKPFVPSQSPYVRYDRLPKWFRNEMKTSTYLSNSRTLTFESVLDSTISAKLEKCNWTTVDKEFLLSRNNTYEEKSKRLEGLSRCFYKLQLSYLMNAQNETISKAVGSVINIYAGSGYSNLNRKLYQEKAEEELPYALLLYDSLKYRKTPYNNGTLYRGGICNVTGLISNVGKVIEVDAFSSFSKDISVAKEFLENTYKEKGFEGCLITMSLENDDHCGVDIEDVGISDEKEVLVPFSTKVRLLNVLQANTTSGESPYYEVTWGCAEKVFDDEANSINKPAIKASKIFDLD